MPSAKEVIFGHYVDAGEVPPDTFRLTEKTVNDADVPDGGALVEVLFLSVDPYMRPLMRDIKGHYTQPFTPGQPLQGGGVVRVLSSKSTEFATGDVAVGRGIPWATHAILSADALQAARKVSPSAGVSVSAYLGTLGMPGLTAYASLKHIADPKPGETAFVSAATGAVGQVVGQLLKNVYGCKVIGSAGADDKVQLLKDWGYDYAFNYKTTDTRQALQQALTEFGSKGIDIYYENVGGPTLDIVLELAAPFGRIVACGMISQYALPDEQRYGVKNLFLVVGKQLKMQGFIVGSLAPQYSAAFAEEMPQFIQQGKVKILEDVTKGIENVGEAFRGLMAGRNRGKAVVQVAESL